MKTWPWNPALEWRWKECWPWNARRLAILSTSPGWTVDMELFNRHGVELKDFVSDYRGNKQNYAQLH